MQSFALYLESVTDPYDILDEITPQAVQQALAQFAQNVAAKDKAKHDAIMGLLQPFQAELDNQAKFVGWYLDHELGNQFSNVKVLHKGTPLERPRAYETRMRVLYTQERRFWDIDNRRGRPASPEPQLPFDPDDHADELRKDSQNGCVIYTLRGKQRVIASGYHYEVQFIPRNEEDHQGVLAAHSVEADLLPDMALALAIQVARLLKVIPVAKSTTANWRNR